jgi:hypothetical protein
MFSILSVSKKVLEMNSNDNKNANQEKRILTLKEIKYGAPQGLMLQ